MHISYRIAKRALPHLNDRPLTESDFERATAARGVIVHFEALECNGFYHPWYTRTGGWERHIYINAKLSRLFMLETCWHEFAHMLLHVPSPPQYRAKQEAEARLIASVALIPGHHLESEYVCWLPYRVVMARATARTVYGI